jgi:hypothetical protein
MVALANWLTSYMSTNHSFLLNTFHGPYRLPCLGTPFSLRHIFDATLVDELGAESLLSIGHRVNGLSQRDINSG